MKLMKATKVFFLKNLGVFVHARWEAPVSTVWRHWYSDFMFWEIISHWCQFVWLSLKSKFDIKIANADTSLRPKTIFHIFTWLRVQMRAAVINKKISSLFQQPTYVRSFRMRDYFGGLGELSPLLKSQWRRKIEIPTGLLWNYIENQSKSKKRAQRPNERVRERRGCFWKTDSNILILKPQTGLFEGTRSKNIRGRMEKKKNNNKKWKKNT